MNLTVDTSEYFRTHLHAPRCEAGYKQGLWIFFLGRSHGFGTEWIELSVTASYSAAKRQALHEAKRLGCNKINLSA